MPRPPNLLLIVTDQQRQAMHWPRDAGWLRSLMPAHAELERTGLTFTHACTNTCMCSPSRATMLTGRMPAEHGVVLTHTRGGARPARANLLETMRAGAGRSIGDGVSPLTGARALGRMRSEEHTSELQSRGHLVCRLLLEKKKEMTMIEVIGILIDML